jgi:hypothetical protein
MGFPKQIKKNIELTPYRTLYPRRVELLDKINEHGTFLPKSILHADLDGGFLDFVKNDLKVVTEGKVIPTTDILITTQNWAQFTQTWNFQDLDKNVSPPFITVVRNPEIKYGSLPSLQWTIPNRKEFYYASVPSFDGNRINVDVYKIPQPVPVDIKYSVKIICNRMRELNTLNKTILQKFSSRQAYTQIKGHYIPIIMDSVSDESVMDVEKRKYYIQSYEFIMMGFLMDEDEFEVKPGVERVFQLFETTQGIDNRKRKSLSDNPKNYNTTIEFVDENVLVTKRFYDKVDLTLIKTNNVESYDVFVNDEYYGINPIKIQLNPDSIVRFEIVKESPNQTSTIEFKATIV